MSKFKVGDTVKIFTSYGNIYIKIIKRKDDTHYYYDWFNSKDKIETLDFPEQKALTYNKVIKINHYNTKLGKILYK